jgi:hypothetical protein
MIWSCGGLVDIGSRLVIATTGIPSRNLRPRMRATKDPNRQGYAVEILEFRRYWRLTVQLTEI